MATRTLSQLRTRAKQRSNQENSDFVAPTEWSDYLNYAISELRDIIISKVGDDYFASTQSYSLTAGTESYALPVNFYKALWLELLCDDGYYRKLKRYEITEKNDFRLFNIGNRELFYRMVGDNILFTPPESIGGRTVRLWFVPLAQELSADSDTLIGFNGWDEYVVLKAAIMALEKAEQDTSAVSLRLEQLRIRIEAMAENRDQSQPMRITDSSRNYQEEL
jgi:hypothetical protein